MIMWKPITISDPTEKDTEAAAAEYLDVEWKLADIILFVSRNPHLELDTEHHIYPL